MTNCILCGVGGQGTVLASKLIALAAINSGLSAHTSETIGMAQRGGCVVSHVRIGEKINAPMIAPGTADIIIGFEPGEAVRYLSYLKKDGIVVTSCKAVRPVTASLGFHYDSNEMIDYLKKNYSDTIFVDADKICGELGTSKVLNVALLGAAANSGKLGITLSQLEDAIRTKLPQKFIEINLKALCSAVNL